MSSGLFFNPGFMPHIHCYLDRQPLVWTMLITDLLIGLAYVGISITLWRLIKRIKLSFSFIILCFGVFIGACGATHFMEVWTLWNPNYWVAAFIKTITAIASVGTCIYLYRLRHEFIAIAEASRASETDRQKLAAMTHELERRVHERTQQLNESEERFRLVANSIPQLAWMSDRDGSISWYNQRWYDYTGTTLEEMQGWGWQKVHHPDHEKSVTEKWLKHLKSGEEWEDTFPLRSKNGNYRWFLSRAVPGRDAEGNITRWFGSNTDVTELREALKARDTFLSIASHELKTPLTSLHLATQLRQRELKRNFPEAFTQERALKFLNAQAAYVSRLNRLVEDLLDVSRISEGRFTLDVKPFDLCEMVQELVERFRVTAEASGVDLQLDACERVSGSWDRFRLEQVILNLLTNAVKYGQGKPVRLKVFQKDSTAVISVKDQGMGIRAEDQVRIFSRYERAISENEVSGLGLGLYISNEIVKAHRGAIQVRSELGKGSEFLVVLPMGDQVVDSSRKRQR